MKKLCLLVILFLTACSSAVSATPTVQPTLLSTSIPAATSTPNPTATNTPEPTATLALPVSQGTPFPFQLPLISSENAVQLSEIFKLQDDPIVWNGISVGDYTVLDTNQGVQIKDDQGVIIANLAPAEVFCPVSRLQQSGYEGGKIFIGTGNRVAIATVDEVRIYSFQGDLLQAMPLKKEFIPDNNDTCGAEGVYRFSPNLEWVAVGYPVHMDFNNISVSVYDLRTGSSVLEVPNAYMPRFFTPDGKYLIVEDYDSRFFVYQTSDWTRVSLLSATDRFLGTDLSLSPDGQLLVAYPFRGVLTFYQILKGNKIPLEAFTCGDLPNCGADVQFSKDGKKLKVEGEKGVFVYDLSTWQKIDSQGEYNASQWEKAIPETSFIQPNYEKGVNKKTFTFSGHNKAFVAMLGTDSNNFCVMLTNGEEVCGILPPIDNWESMEFGKTTMIPLTDDVMGRCILFASNELTCFPQYSSNDGLLISRYDGDELCVKMPDGEWCISIPLSEWSSVYRLINTNIQFDVNSQIKDVAILFDTRGVYCLLDSSQKTICWSTINDWPENNSMGNIRNSAEESGTDVCAIGLDGNRSCESFSAGKLVFTDATGNLHTLSRVEPNRLQLGRESDNVILTTVDMDPQGKVLWFQVLAEEKYLAYAVQSELADGIHIKLRIVTMDGVELLSRDVAVIDYYAASPDGRYFAHSGFANYDMVRGFVWDIGNSKTIFKWMPQGFNNDAITFTPDSKYFVYIERSENKKEPWKERGSVRFIDLEAQKVVRELPVEFFHNGVNVMTFTPDGKLLAMGLNDGTIWIFDVDSSAQIASWKAHIGQLNSLEFSPDGELLLSSGTLDGKTSLWGVYP